MKNMTQRIQEARKLDEAVTEHPMTDRLLILICSLKTASLSDHMNHLNIKGARFNNLHRLFQDQYEYYENTFDLISELIAQSGDSVIVTNLTLLQRSVTKDCDGSDLSPRYLIQASLNNLNTLLNYVNDTIELNRELNLTLKNPIDDALISMSSFLTKQQWLLQSNLDNEIK